jgi:hypothetical protein
VAGQVTNATSLFEYIGGSNYSSYNPSTYSTIDFPTFSDPGLQEAANALCSEITNSALNIKCRVYVPQIGNYYQSCLNDIAATGDISLAEPSIYALCHACIVYSNQDLETAPEGMSL